MTSSLAGAKIAVVNAVLSNTGDAAIYQSIVDSVVSVGADPRDITCFDSDASTTKRLYPQWNILQQLAVARPREPAALRSRLQRVRLAAIRAMVKNPGTWLRATRLPILRSLGVSRCLHVLSEADLVISSGGTYLVDHYDFAPRTEEARLYRALDKPFMLWTQSMGPFATDRSRRQIGPIQRAASAVYFRDEPSQLAWAGLSEPPRMSEVVPDSVFALNVADHLISAERTSKHALVSVRRWDRGGVRSSTFDTAAYDSMMRESARVLDAANFDVRSLSTCQGVPSYPYDDSREARRIFEGLPVTIDAAFHPPCDLLTQVALASAVIATRMHLAILALISGTPVIAVAYERKTIELFTSLNMADNVLAIEDSSQNWVRERLAELVHDPRRFVLTAAARRDVHRRAQAPRLAAARLYAGHLTTDLDE